MVTRCGGGCVGDEGRGGGGEGGAEEARARRVGSWCIGGRRGQRGKVDADAAGAHAGLADEARARRPVRAGAVEYPFELAHCGVARKSAWRDARS